MRLAVLCVTQITARAGVLPLTMSFQLVTSLSFGPVDLAEAGSTYQ
jgi:hypothetical protein